MHSIKAIGCRISYRFKDSSTVMAIRASSYKVLRLSFLQIASMTANRSWSASHPNIGSTKDETPANNTSKRWTFSVCRTELIETMVLLVSFANLLQVIKIHVRVVHPPKEDTIHIHHLVLVVTICLVLGIRMSNSALTCLFFFLGRIQIQPFVQSHSLDLQHTHKQDIQ